MTRDQIRKMEEKWIPFKPEYREGYVEEIFQKGPRVFACFDCLRKANYKTYIILCGFECATTYMCQMCATYRLMKISEFMCYIQVPKTEDT